MRNLWNFIVQYQVILVFMVLQSIALSWLVSSHGFPRGQWVRFALKWESAWQGRVSEWAQRAELSEQNFQLLEENARLRSQVTNQNGHGAPRPSGTQFYAAQVIRSTWTKSQNHFILDRGSKHGIRVGQGVTNNGAAIGKIIETTEEYALGIPLIHVQLDWSARIGHNGAIGRLKWAGSDHRKGVLLDIPRSANFSAGDSILTTGFQGVFPADLLFGVVSEEAPFFDGEFLNVPVTWSTDFQALRYAQVAELKDRALLDDMENSMNDTQP
jgi:rod shape-determining protein MreC